MNKVLVELDASRTKHLNNARGSTQYEGWVPSDYTGAQLRDDVVRYWDLDAAKYELLDGVANAIVADDTSLDALAATTFTLRKRSHKSPLDDEAVDCLQHRQDDPFWLQEKLFDVFLIHALPHWNGKGTVAMSCYQFKQLVLKALAQQAKTSPRDLTVRMTLAFKTATPNSSGAGATFDEFLDALMDVATYLFPRLRSGSKERALEQLAQTYLIPYYDALERRTVHHRFPSWSVIDDLVLARPKVTQLLQRFAPSLFEIALAYTTSVTGPRRQRGLQFQEFSRFVHDLKPRAVPLNTLELCFCFIHCCRIELSQGFTSPLPATLSDARGSLASVHTGADGSGRGVLEISCAHAVHALAYLALLSMPSLALTKPKVSSDDNQRKPLVDRPPGPLRGRISSAVAVLSIKAFLHCISLRVASTGRATATAVATASPRFASARKDTTLPLVSVNFIQEFSRMHRDDRLDDYLGSCGVVLQQREDDVMRAKRDNPEQQIESNESPSKETQHPEQEDDPPKTELDADEDLGLEIDWGEEDAEASEPSDDDDASPTTRECNDEITPEAMALRHAREHQVLQSMMNDADEIYTFLVSELHRYAAENRLEDTELVPQMLDIWVTAGQKYAQVLNYLDARMQDLGDADEHLVNQKARVLERFGASLYVFAMQLLKSTSTVFAYEELFHVTNARVYTHVSPERWHGVSSPAFTTDLATETLSLASGKLGMACKLLEELYRLVSARANVPTTEEDDDDAMSPLNVADRYFQSLLHRANCLDVYGDVLGHTKPWKVDFDLGCALEDDHDQPLSTSPQPPASPGAVAFYSSAVVLAKTSSAGQFYREAKRMYAHLAGGTTRHGWHSSNGAAVSERLANVKLKLAAHLPRGCLAEKHLLEHALQRISTAASCPDSLKRSEGRISAKRAYIRAIRALRTKFFQPETDKTAFEDVDADAIVPFYRFVLVAALREVDPGKTGRFGQAQLSQLNAICGRSAVAPSVLTWLLQQFDHHAELSSLTEKGMFQYFCWLAESDPVTFCEVLDLLTAKYTETPVSITSGIASQTGKDVKPKSLRAALFNHTRQPTSATVLASTASKPDPLRGLADCVVVVSATMTTESCGDVAQTVSPSAVQLEPVVNDVLPLGADVPEELAKFCFPDDIFISTEPRPPMAFDIVLTDVTGARQYGACLHFVEERDPIDVLAMISAMQRGSTTANLPSWISLKEIQQRKATTKFFIPKCLCLLSRLPLFQTLRECLATIYRLSISAPPFPIEAFVFNVLEQIPVPSTANRLTSFTLVDKVRVLASLPPAVPLLFPAEVDFTLLFQCLSAENILKVYGFLLTEKKVVLSSRNVAVLTPCAETLRALLYPFEYQAVYIPVLPPSLLDFVTAPVPFFMGVCSDLSMDRLTSEGVVVVNLDKDEVVEPPNTDDLPVLPEALGKKLLQSLRKTNTWASSQLSRSSCGRFQRDELAEITSYTKIEVSDSDALQLYQLQEDAQEKWTELYVLFTTFVMRLLKDFRKYSRRDTNADGKDTTVFDKKTFLAMHPSQRDFCVHLVQTQHFQRFIDTSASLSESVLQLAASNAEQSWRNVRSKSIMIRRGDFSDLESAKTPTRHVTHAPSLSRMASRHGSGSSHRRRPSGRYAGVEILAPFNSHLYEELRGLSNTSQDSPREESVPQETSSKPPVLAHSGSAPLPCPRSRLVASEVDITSSNLIFAARQRLDLAGDQ